MVSEHAEAQKAQKYDSWPNGKGRFLRAVAANGGNVSAACAATNTPRDTVYNWRRDVPGFREAWDEAREAGREQLIQDARDYAHGAFRPGAELTAEGMRAALRLLSNAARDLFGERVENDHRGEVRITGVEHTIVRPGDPAPDPDR